jgi:hypothetical protein
MGQAGFLVFLGSFVSFGGWGRVLNLDGFILVEAVKWNC